MTPKQQEPAPKDQAAVPQAAHALLAAVDAEMADDWTCNSYHPSLRPAAEDLRAALSAADPGALDREQMADLAMAVGELSRAMGSPCVFGKYPATLLSATVRQAAFRLAAAAASSGGTAPSSGDSLASSGDSAAVPDEREAYDAWFKSATFADMGSDWTFAGFQAGARWRAALSTPAAPVVPEPTRAALEAAENACARIIEQYGGIACGINFHALAIPIRAALAATPATTKETP